MFSLKRFESRPRKPKARFKTRTCVRAYVPRARTHVRVNILLCIIVYIVRSYLFCPLSCFYNFKRARSCFEGLSCQLIKDTSRGFSAFRSVKEQKSGSRHFVSVFMAVDEVGRQQITTSRPTSVSLSATKQFK